MNGVKVPTELMSKSATASLWESRNRENDDDDDDDDDDDVDDDDDDGISAPALKYRGKPFFTIIVLASLFDGLTIRPSVRPSVMILSGCMTLCPSVYT